MKYTIENKVVSSTGLIFFFNSSDFLVEKISSQDYYFPLAKIKSEPTYRASSRKIFIQPIKFDTIRKIHLVLGTLFLSYQVNRLGSCTFVTTHTHTHVLKVLI
jgi:hypothetical protein